MDTDDWIAVDVTGPIGQSPIVLVCEHASAFIPEEFGGLGLTRDAASSHAAWDIGALDVAKFLSSGLGAPLVAGRVSRLVYDCNRPLDSAGAIPAKSEIYDVPGNVDLSDEERQRRYDLIHQPFHAAVANILFAQEQAMARPPILVTVHSFTPVYNGVQRNLDIGYLFDSRPALAEAALAAEQGAGQFKAALNEPYAPKDGVTHTLVLHGDSQGRENVMIEVRNDLIDTSKTAASVAAHLQEVLTKAVAQISQTEGQSG